MPLVGECFKIPITLRLALLAVSGGSLSEKELYDIAYFELRNLLGAVPGVIAPAVYGGKLRRIYLYVHPDKLQAYNLAQTDVIEAVQKNNVMIPTGDANIGNLNYSVNANGMLPKVADFNDIVIKMNRDGSPIFLKDIGYAKDASAIQTNMVHINGKRQVYIPVYKRTGANTIAAVDGIKDKLTELKERLCEAVNLDVVLDQSIYVRHSINGLPSPLDIQVIGNDLHKSRELAVRVRDIVQRVKGSAAEEIEEKLVALRQELPEGYRITMRGEVKSMRDSFGSLGLGLMLAIILVYLVIVPLLRSFKLPLIIITVIPLGLIGVTGMLLVTSTYLNIQSIMGVIMMVGITVAYSNLLVDKMNNLFRQGMPLIECIQAGAGNRFRPIIMTAIVATFALLPMALGLETGGEANVPLARAIIGGVLAATFLSLFVVPVLFFTFNKNASHHEN